MPSTIVWIKGSRFGWLASPLLVDVVTTQLGCNKHISSLLGMEIVRNLMISVISLPAGLISITNVKQQRTKSIIHILDILGQFEHALQDPVQ